MIISNGQPVTVPLQALAEVTPQLYNGYYYGQQGIELDDKKFAYYRQLYMAQPWLATVVDKIAASAARLSFQVWDAAGNHKVLDNTSAYARLWAQPCNYLSTYQFWSWTFATYELCGEAYWAKMRNDAGQVTSLAPIIPERLTVKRNELGETVYIFNVATQFSADGLLELGEHDVVPFRRFNPLNTMRGQSRVESLRTTLQNEDATRRAIQSWWQRGARPSLMLSTDGKLSDQALDRLKRQVAQDHAGASKAAGTLILEEGMKPVPVQLNAEEMAYIQSRQLNREEVCAVYDVPPPVVHILDHATFSNISEQMRSMYRDTMAPRLQDIESAVDKFLRPDFDQTGQTTAAFALDEVLRGDFETRSVAVVALINAGVMKPSEGRALFDLDDAGPRADKLYANSALQELGMPAERVTLRATPPETPPETQLVNAAADDAAQVAADQVPQNGGKRLRTHYLDKEKSVI